METRAEQHFHSLMMRAFDLPPEERQAFVEETFRDQPAMLAEAMALLRGDSQMGDFLERPAIASEGMAAGGIAPPIDPPLLNIGPYKILETLGEGGMGRVLLAEQTEPLRRKVALKLIRHSVWNPKAAARFDLERQAMARLSHPNIGQVYDAGTAEDGTPYFAMEHLEGEPITVYCDQKKLSLEERLRLFSAVCQGVQHAPQKQILHRDLKPTNILVTEVDGKAVPKIIDFGIAKSLDQSLTEATLATGAQLLGTPTYMSPESLNLEDGTPDVDTRTDVYSLGVVLYVLLTGKKPFVGNSLMALINAHRFSSVPALPTTRQPLIRAI